MTYTGNPIITRRKTHKHGKSTGDLFQTISVGGACCLIRSECSNLCSSMGALQMGHTV